MTTLIDGAAPAAPAAPAAAAAPASPASGAAAPAAPEFKADEARAFLTQHGVDAKSLEGLDETALKDRYGLAKGIAEKAAAGAKPKAPEKYELKAPEGVKLDETATKEFEALAREDGISNEKAQKYMELGAKIAKSQVSAIEKAVETQQAQWAEQSRKDSEFGGEKLDENLSVAKLARDEFASEGLRDLLQTSKLGNHPEVIRLFFRIGRAMKQDKVVTEGRGVRDTGDIAQRLYGAKA